MKRLFVNPRTNTSVNRHYRHRANASTVYAGGVREVVLDAVSYLETN